MFKLITAIIVIVVRRLLIQYCGNEINGLNSLYISIIGFLSVAELGVGTAISFCMYKPIVEGDANKVSALYHLIRRLYLIIGGVILAAGLLVMPFLPIFARDYIQLDINIYSSFLLMLISIVITYLFGAKTALINAYKDNYITTTINSVGQTIQYVLQIVALLTTHSFYWYLICRIVAGFAQWIATEWVARKNYFEILANKQGVDRDTKQEVTKNTKAMFMHKVGTLLVNSTDNVIISMFVGIAALGEYSNYNVVLKSLAGILTLVFTSLTSVFGHLYAKENKIVARKYYEVFCILNFILGTVFYLGYYAIIDNLVSILFATDLVLERSISTVITLNGFVQFLRRNTLTFREATGTYFYDRWKPIVEGILNLILSVAFAHWIGVTGVIVATIVTNLLICHVVEPYVLYKHAFETSPRQYYIKNYSMILLFCVAMALLDSVMQITGNQWTQLLINGFISVGISSLVCLVAMLMNMKTCRFAWNVLKER